MATRVRGRLFSVTDLAAFIESFQTDPEDPDPNTFRPFTRARVHLGFLVPAVVGGFLPRFSQKDDTDQEGAFAFEVPQGIEALPGLRAHVVVFHQLVTPLGSPLLLGPA